MYFMPYLFKKDFIRLRLLLFIWFVLILTQSALGIGGINLVVDNFELQMFLPMFGLLINFLQGLIIIIIVPLLVQDDSLVSTNAFWFTRPISRKGLLITKSYFILTLLILLPFLAEVFVLIANGVTANHILLAVPEILIEKLVFIIPIFILAVLTPKFSRFALVCVTLVAAFVVIGILGYILVIFFPGLSKIFYNYKLIKNAALELSVLVVRNLFVIVCGSFLIIHQYLTRNTAWTVRWLIASYLLMMCVTRIWDWDFLKEVSTVRSAVNVSDSLRVDFDTRYVIISDEFRLRKNDIREKSISIKQEITGLPPGQFAVLRRLKDVQMLYPDGSILRSKYISTSKKETFADEKFMSPLQVVLGDTKLLNPFKGRFSYTEIFSLEEADFNRYKNRHGIYSAHAVFDIYKYKISSTMPLRRGAKDLFGSEQIIIYDVLERPNGISVIVGEKKTNLLFDRSVRKRSRYDFVLEAFSDFNHVYIIRNRRREEAFLAEVGGNVYPDMTAVYGRSRLQVKAKQLDFMYVNDRSGPLPEIDQGWLADAELVRIDAVKVGLQHKNFKFKKFSLPSKSTGSIPEIDDIDRRLRQNEREFEEQMKKWE